jgi:diaminopimelate epimerase
MKFHAHKYHALGNDYLVIDPRELEISLTPSVISLLCDRNRGIGSDGILYGPISLGAGTDCYDFSLRIFNPDGSEAEKSGNGLRIFSLFLYETGSVGDDLFKIGTKGGIVKSRILPAPENAQAPFANRTKTLAEAGERLIEISMGEPKLLPAPESMTFEGMAFRVVRVSMGNPHCVLFGQVPTPELAQRIGPLVERNPLFPDRTNVQFVEVIDRRTIRIEIWERGAGYTLASGSSSCAAAAAAHSLGLVDELLTVYMPGGALSIDMRKKNIKMTGPAVHVFDVVLSEYLLNFVCDQPKSREA